MEPARNGLDETKYSLVEHLSELRVRLVKALLGIFLTTGAALFFSPELLDYTIQPLQEVLRERTRVEALLIHDDRERGEALAARLGEHAGVRFAGRFTKLADVRALAEEKVADKRPLDLIIVSASAIQDDGALVSDLLDDIEPSPEVVYLVKDVRDPAVVELQLEGAALIPDPPRASALNRVIRRAAAAAGKSSSGDKLVVLSPLDPFFAYLKVALVIGLFLACPIWLYQAWSFVAPGLYATEKAIVLPCIIGGSLLFITGGLFAYYVMFPVMFDVLVNQMMPDSLSGAYTVEKYLSLLLTMTVAFGVVFETPLAIAVLAMFGIVTPDVLRRVRKYQIVGSFVFAAVITPTTDPLSLLMMAIPLVLFYELGIIFAVLVQRGKKRAPAVA